MNASNIIAILAIAVPTLISLLIFTFWLAKTIIELKIKVTMLIETIDKDLKKREEIFKKLEEHESRLKILESK